MDQSSDETTLNPHAWVTRYGDVFYRYALSRLNDKQAAEDVVQETFLAAIKAAEKFRGECKEGTWLTTILRRKTIDVLRVRERQRRQHPISGKVEINDCSDDQCVNIIGASFSASPSKPVNDAEFMDSLRACLAKIPRSQADVFVLREIEQMEPEEICEQLGITRKNLWVRLHRARLALAECINSKYLAPEVDRAK